MQSWFGRFLQLQEMGRNQARNRAGILEMAEVVLGLVEMLGYICFTV